MAPYYPPTLPPRPTLGHPCYVEPKNTEHTLSYYNLTENEKLSRLDTRSTPNQLQPHSQEPNYKLVVHCIISTLALIWLIVLQGHAFVQSNSAALLSSFVLITLTMIAQFILKKMDVFGGGLSCLMILTGVSSVFVTGTWSKVLVWLCVVFSSFTVGRIVTNYEF